MFLHGSASKLKKEGLYVSGLALTKVAMLWGVFVGIVTRSRSIRFRSNALVFLHVVWEAHLVLTISTWWGRRRTETFVSAVFEQVCECTTLPSSKRERG